MQRLRACLIALLTVALVVLPRVAAAQDAPSDDDVLRARVDMIRGLPTEDRERLRAALERFRALPAARREELRRKATEVGPERLGELIGRDVDNLRKRRAALVAERAEILRLLGGAARFADLSPEQKEHLQAVVLRRFQLQVRRMILGIAGPAEMEQFNKLTPTEKKAALESKLAALETKLLEEQTDETRREFLTWPPQRQKRFRRELLADYRLRLVPGFVQAFDKQFVVPFLHEPPEVRQAKAEAFLRQTHWFEIERRLDRELGVSRAHLRLLSEMGPTEWGRVRDVYIRSADKDPAERRLELEREIDELHGRNADDPSELRRGPRDRLRRLLREQRRRRAEETR